MEDLIDRMYTNVIRIFNLPPQPESWVEVDLDAENVITAQNMYSRAGWTPFEGMQVRGRVRQVVLRGEVAFADGEVLAPQGFGRRIR